MKTHLHPKTIRLSACFNIYFPS
uniref:Uncharacterized protein n=1 Tax=Anguilla anguilla TaxID=7936 RepID=A0A0E9RR46_ANGAN